VHTDETLPHYQESHELLVHPFFPNDIGRVIRF